LSTQLLQTNFASQLGSTFNSQEPVATELNSNSHLPATNLGGAAIAGEAVETLPTDRTTSRDVSTAPQHLSQAFSRGQQTPISPQAMNTISPLGVESSTMVGSTSMSDKEVVSIVARTPSMSEKEVIQSSPGSSLSTGRSFVASADRLATLGEEQARLAEKRKRFEALQAIEAQEDDLKRQIVELET
jgi:hypothetical protein